MSEVSKSAITLEGSQGGEVPGSVLSQVQEWQSNARADRHAYWLPLLVFGLLVCASAPMYTQPVLPDGGYGTGDDVGPWLSGLGGNVPVTAPVRGLYWWCAIAMGAAVTAAWYSWHARLTGIATRVRGSLVALALAVAALVVVASVWGPVLSMVSQLLTVRGTSGLLVVAVGLAVLSWLERSWALAVWTIGYAAVAGYGVLSDPANLVYTVFRWFGVADPPLPLAVAGTLNVLVPGMILLVAGFVTFRIDLRRR